MENISDDTLQFGYKEVTDSNKCIIKAVGVGGGGSNAVENMYKEGIQDVTFLIINTDAAALQKSNVPNKLAIAELGAGAQPDVAYKYAIEHEDEIRSALSDGTKMIFITAGMGGGTGTGASPVVARIAQELGILTIGIVTIPFKFEGRKKIQMALNGVAEIRQYVDALLVVNNNRLIEIYPDLNFFNAFKKADDTLTNATRSISDIINKTGYMNLDFKDVETTLKDSGVALISSGEAEGEGRVSQAIKNAITSPLLQDNDITNAKRLLFELCYSGSNPPIMEEMDEFNQFVDGLSSELGVIWGALQDDDLGDKVRVIVLAAGFDDSAVSLPAAPKVEKPEKQPQAQPQPESHPEPNPEPHPKPNPESILENLENLENLEELEDLKAPQPDQEPQPEPVVEAPEPRPQTDVQKGLDEIRRFYGEEIAAVMHMDQIRKNYYKLNDPDLTNEELVSLLEKLPTYNRTEEQMNQIKAASQQANRPSAPLPSADGTIVF